MRNAMDKRAHMGRQVAAARLCLYVARAGLIGGIVLAAFKGAHWLLIGLAWWALFSFAKPGPRD